MEKQIKKRIAWLDTVRVVAIIMVVFMHAPIPGRNLQSSNLLGALSYLTFPCIGLFFMASGALLLPVQISFKDFLWHRFSRIFFPTIVWSLLYVSIKYFYHEINLTEVGKLLLNIPFRAVEGVLWFMYTMTGLYLFAPIISKWLENALKNEIEYFLFFWLVVMSFPYINAFIQIPESDYHLLSTFSGFMGYMVLGFYLKNFSINLSKTSNIIKVGVGIFVLSVLLPSLFYLNPPSDFDPGTILYNYLSVSVVAMSFGWFVFIQNLNKLHSKIWFTNIVQELSIMSFGIYLAHIFVMRRLIWNWLPTGAIPLGLEVIIVSILTFVLTYFLVKIISKLPGKKYIIG